MAMSFSEYDVTRRTRKGDFLKQIDQWIDWNSIEKAITVHYAPVLDAAGRAIRRIRGCCCSRWCWLESGTAI